MTNRREFRLNPGGSRDEGFPYVENSNARLIQTSASPSP